MTAKDFECAAVGCEEKTNFEGGLCTAHLRRDIEAARNDGPRVPRKTETGGNPKKKEKAVEEKTEVLHHRNGRV